MPLHDWRDDEFLSAIPPELRAWTDTPDWDDLPGGPSPDGLTPDRTYRPASSQGFVDYHQDEAGHEYVRCRFTSSVDQSPNEVASMFPLRWERVDGVRQRIVDGQVVIEVTRIDGRVFGVIVEPDDGPPFEAAP